MCAVGGAGTEGWSRVGRAGRAAGLGCGRLRPRPTPARRKGGFPEGRPPPCPQARLARGGLGGIFGGGEGGALLTHRSSRPVGGPPQARALVVVWRKASGRSRGPRRLEFHKTGRVGSAYRPRPARAERLASSSWRSESWEHRSAPALSLGGTAFASGVPSRCLGGLVRCWLQFRVLFCCVCGASRVWESW